MLYMHYSKLLVWQKAMNFAEYSYGSIRSFPKEETYGLASQIRRAVVSVPSNIAEGSQRTSNKDFANFLLIAKGSLAEVQTQFLLAYRLGYLDDQTHEKLALLSDELHKMIYALHCKLFTGN